MTPRFIAAVVVSVLAAFALFGLDGKPRLQIDSSPAALGGGDDPGSRDLALSLEVVEGRIGLGEILLAERLSEALLQVRGVYRVRSVVSAELPQAVGEDIDITPLIRRVRAQPENAEALIDEVAADPLVRGRLVSADGRALLLLVELLGEDENEVRLAARRVRDRTEVELHGRQDVRWLVTGAPLITDSIGRLLVQQMIVVLPTAILVCAMVLWLAFRRLSVVISCLLTVAASVWWTLGLAAALGWNLNLVTILVPPLVTTLSVAYSMHVVAAYSDHRDIAAAMRHVRLPLLITAVTTMVGLLALAVNPLLSVRQFAVLGAFGALAGAFAADAVLPALLSRLGRPPELWPPVNSWLMQRGRAMANFAVDNSTRVSLVGGVVFVLALIGASQVESGARYIRDLSPAHPERQAFEALNKQFSGANGFRVEIAGAGDDVMLNPTMLAAVDELQRWLEAQPEIGSTLSLIDYIKRINQVFSGDDPAAHTLPGNQMLTKQLLAVAAPEEAYKYTDLIYSRLLIEVTTPEVDSARLRELFQRLETRLDALPPGVEAKLGGSAVELSRSVETLTGGQLRSISIAAFAIFVVLSVLFASVRVGFQAMLPNLLPIAVYFGILGVLGIPLGPTTALVACIVLGIAVDDTLHLMVRFNELARRRADEEKAAREAVAEVIRPITLTTIAVSLGFLILVTSPFHSQVVFGLLAATTLLVAWLSDLMLTPAISARASIVTLWDVVRLDLGENPQATIPLFEGMTSRQARLLALYAQIRHIAPGEALFSQGEVGRELYVVIDGELKIWIKRREGEELALAQLGRGTTIGEGGLFNERRTATVSAVRPTRVMVFDPGTLEQVRKRNPRVGALVYRNLNRIQAERLAGTTHRLAEITQTAENPPPPQLRTQS